LGVKANCLYEIDERGGAERARDAKSLPKERPALFEDVSDRINHNHHEEDFNDFERQPLLPKKLSQLGPGVAWGDVDGDGRDDLIIGSGKGGPLALFHSERNGGFKRIEGAPWDTPATRDQTTILIW